MSNLRDFLNFSGAFFYEAHKRGGIRLTAGYFRDLVRDGMYEKTAPLGCFLGHNLAVASLLHFRETRVKEQE